MTHMHSLYSVEKHKVKKKKKIHLFLGSMSVFLRSMLFYENGNNNFTCYKFLRKILISISENYDFREWVVS